MSKRNISALLSSKHDNNYLNFLRECWFVFWIWRDRSISRLILAPSCSNIIICCNVRLLLSCSISLLDSRWLRSAILLVSVRSYWQIIQWEWCGRIILVVTHGRNTWRELTSITGRSLLKSADLHPILDEMLKIVQKIATFVC